MNRNGATRYTSLQITLHWITLLLIVAVYACIELRELYPRGSGIRETLKSWHYTLGLAVFGLVWLRLLARLFGRVPPIVPQPPKWQLHVAHAAELTIYVFMIAMPLLGWMILSGEGKPVPFFGMQLPALIAENKGFARQLEEIHEVVGNIGYALIGLHAAAALVHHYFNHDNTLLRMLPLRRRS
jgi:cytochrome b561